MYPHRWDRKALCAVPLVRINGPRAIYYNERIKAHLFKC
jgi:hypothetical protein